LFVGRATAVWSHVHVYDHTRPSPDDRLRAIHGCMHGPLLHPTPLMIGHTTLVYVKTTSG